MMGFPRGSRFGGCQLGTPDEGVTCPVHFLWSRLQCTRRRLFFFLGKMCAGARRMLAGCAVSSPSSASSCSRTPCCSALSLPLIPGYASDLGLSKLQAGLFLGAYGAGALVGGIPSGIFAARVGPRRAVLAGLLLLSGYERRRSRSRTALSRSVSRGSARALRARSTWAGALAWITVGDRQGSGGVSCSGRSSASRSSAISSGRWSARRRLTSSRRSRSELWRP